MKQIKKEHIIGTTKYLSTNVLEYQTPSRRDDLISICYLLFELAIGELPWSSQRLYDEFSTEFFKLTRDEKKVRLRKVGHEKKKQYTGNQLYCLG